MKQKPDRRNKKPIKSFQISPEVDELCHILAQAVARLIKVEKKQAT